MGPVIAAAPGAHHYRFVGVEIAPRDGVFLKNLIELGIGASSVDSLPHHLSFERCYVHGDRVLGARRGIAMNARNVLVADSYFADFNFIRGIVTRMFSWIIDFDSRCSFIIIDKSFSTFLVVFTGPICVWISHKSILFEENKFTLGF